jgi:GNAT superfamily N-acetyltransferase
MNNGSNILGFDNYSFSEITSVDCSELAQIHIKAFPNFFLTQLGKKVLAVFYHSLINEKATVAWCLKMDTKIIGFFVSSTQLSGLYKYIFKKNFTKFFYPLLVAFIKKPNLIFRILISYQSQSAFVIPDSCSATLLSICVNPDFSGAGLGKRLIFKNDDEFKKLGINAYFLTTDAENNIATNSFYSNIGFHLNSSFYQGKRKMNLYTKMLS